ncbi:SRPBCC family protein [Sporolactobacillus pectinivorans]|uniref:SRPBCC family protein n=1 Tax=Sporolactobacillus pectinivorans TaxID=1591408 RepID=UPI000C260E5C|nr:SRPBCC domain-containing protein [Sporolactobacillus pectinivorans]
MGKLFVDRSIEINAPAAVVWGVLTQQKYSEQWAGEFLGGNSQFYIKSDWGLGSPVLWIDENGSPLFEENVTALEQHKFLRFTVFDIRSQDRPPMTEEDGITYRLSKKNGKTTFQVLQGDFSVMDDGEKYCSMTKEIWDKVLPQIKKLAELSNKKNNLS